MGIGRLKLRRVTKVFQSWKEDLCKITQLSRGGDRSENLRGLTCVGVWKRGAKKWNKYA